MVVSEHADGALVDALLSLVHTPVATGLFTRMSLTPTQLTLIDRSFGNDDSPPAAGEQRCVDADTFNATERLSVRDRHRSCL